MMPFGSVFARASDAAQASSIQTAVVHCKRASQANISVDNATWHAALGTDLLLHNLFRISVNIIGICERDGFSARLTNNWRSRFITGINNYVAVVPVSTKAYNWLDTLISCRIGRQRLGRSTY
jgi:hypothetical protein